MLIMAVDPGSEQSNFLFYDTTKREIGWKESTADYASVLSRFPKPDIIVCEDIECMGQVIGESVIKTAKNIGVYEYVANMCGMKFQTVTRTAIKLHHCNDRRAKDKNIRGALIAKLGEPGTKKKPGGTHGISGHFWSCLAIALYWAETYDYKGNKNA